jgi:hypothetical protein
MLEKFRAPKYINIKSQIQKKKTCLYLACVCLFVCLRARLFFKKYVGQRNDVSEKQKILFDHSELEKKKDI